jgi:hypothetical protein
MNVFGFYTILLFGFLGGFAMAWILLCYKTAQAARHNKNFQLSILERLEAASHKAIHRVSQSNDG